MLYAILKPIVTLALRLYFRRVNASGLERIDNDRPTLILANHTASFMDAILLACWLRRRIYIFTRGDVFSKGWADKLLRSIGLMPVYRLSEGRDKMHLNDNSNEEALKILRQGGAVLIFCEGTSDIAKRLKPLKKGPFRLAAMAAATLSEPPVIVPLGINYVTPTEAGGDAFLEAGMPIETAFALEDQSEAGMAQAATRLMRATNQQLKDLVWHVELQENEQLVNSLLLELQESGHDVGFRETQEVILRVNAGALTAADTREQERKGRLIRALQVLLLPVGYTGWLFHYPPLAVADRIVHHKVKSPDFVAAIFVACAIPLMVVWYLSWLAAGSLLNLSWTWFLALPAAALCGIIYLKVYEPAGG